MKYEPPLAVVSETAVLLVVFRSIFLAAARSLGQKDSWRAFAAAYIIERVAQTRVYEGFSAAKSQIKKFYTTSLIW